MGKREELEVVWFLPATNYYFGYALCSLQNRLCLLHFTKGSIFRGPQNKEEIESFLRGRFQWFRAEDFAALSEAYPDMRNEMRGRFTEKNLEKRFPKEIRERIESEIALHNL